MPSGLCLAKADCTQPAMLHAHRPWGAMWYSKHRVELLLGLLGWVLIVALIAAAGSPPGEFLLAHLFRFPGRNLDSLVTLGQVQSSGRESSGPGGRRVCGVLIKSVAKLEK